MESEQEVEEGGEPAGGDRQGTKREKKPPGEEVTRSREGQGEGDKDKGKEGKGKRQRPRDKGVSLKEAIQDRGKGKVGLELLLKDPRSAGHPCLGSSLSCMLV